MKMNPSEIRNIAKRSSNIAIPETLISKIGFSLAQAFDCRNDIFSSHVSVTYLIRNRLFFI
jgi:hypothetical protein